MSTLLALFDRVRGRRAMRRCTRLGVDARIDGTPTIKNEGELCIGDRFRLSSLPIPSHFVTVPGARIVVGDDVSIAHGAAIAAYERIEIGDGARLGPFVVVMDTDFHAAGDRSVQHTTAPVTIGKGAQIGSHVTILRGSIIGDGAVIESGSVVNGEIAAGARARGVPASTYSRESQPPASLRDPRAAVIDVVKRALGLVEPPREEDGPASIPQWDSLGTLKILLAIETELAIELDVRQLLAIQSLGDLADVVARARREHGPTPSSRRRPITFHSPAVRAREAVFTPSPAVVEASQMTDFARFCARRTNRVLDDAQALHAFSIEERPTFWSLFVEWAGLPLEGELEPSLVGDDGETARFFPHARLSFTASLLRRLGSDDDAHPAITACNERGEVVRLDRGTLRRRVLALAAQLRARGIGPGDRVVAIAANDAEAVVACLATVALGAVWSSVSPELGAGTIVSRFEQLAPKAIFVRRAYLDHGKRVDVGARVDEVVAALPSLESVLELGALEPTSVAPLELDALPRFAFDHPLYVLFSSGTTGKPKCIVHGAGGTLVEHVKEHRLHGDLRPSDKLFFHTTCAWMMWNWLVSALAVGAEIVLYEGSVSHPDAQSLWQLLARERVTVFGTSPAFLQFTATAGVSPRATNDLSALRALMSTGSVLPDTAFEWAREHVGAIPLQSISGGTDILGCFLLGHPNLPVFAGELQAKSLGLDVRAHGAEAQRPIGELVCAGPFPSRPIGLFGDTDGSRFHATYFAQNAGLWTHGDRFEWTSRHTGRIHGRSDGVMNIRGIRIGPAELYGALADVAELVECMAIEQRAPSDPGGTRLALLVVLRDGATFDAALERRLRDLVARRCSRAHVPGAIHAVRELPVTHNGKRAERAARDALNGDVVENVEALRNPRCLDEIRAVLSQKTG